MKRAVVPKLDVVNYWELLVSAKSHKYRPYVSTI